MKEIPGFANYFATADGRIVSTKNKHGKPMRELVAHEANNGYLRVLLRRDGKNYNFCVHKLIMLAFYGYGAPGMEIGHLDGNRHNNNLENLKYVTKKENASHRFGHGTLPLGSKNPNAKLTKEQVESIRQEYRIDPTRKYSRGFGSNRYELAKKYKVGPNQITKIINKVHWGHL